MTTRLVTREVTESPTRLAAGLPIPLLLMPLQTDLRLLRGTGSATFTRSTIKTRADKDDGLVKTAAIDVAAFEQNGILIEGASTNLLLRSEEFDNAVWIKSSGVTVNANATTAPDGATTADELTPSTGGSFVETFQNATVTISNAYTQTYFLKDNGLQFIQIIGPGLVFGDFHVNFDLINGTITQTNTGTSTGLSFSITPAANGFFKVRVTTDALASSASGRLAINYIKTGTTGRGVDEGAFNGTDSIFAWGAQLEQLPFASSYIKTVASTVTRTADNLSIDAANIPAPTADYSVSATVDILGKKIGSTQLLMEVAGESFRFVRVSRSDNQQVNSRAGTDERQLSAITDNTTVKIVDTAVITGAHVLHVDSLTNTGTATAATGTKTGINIGNSSGSTSGLYGHIKNFRIDDVALTAAQVGALP